MLDDPADERPRIVIDESSFGFQGAGLVDISLSFNAFAGALEALLLHEGRQVCISDLLYDQPCLGTDVATVLFSSDSPAVSLGLDHDIRLRVGRLLDRCCSWTSFSDFVARDVRIDGERIDVGSSLSFAVEMALRRHNMACLVLDLASRRGFRQVSADEKLAEVFFFAEAAAMTTFWRELFSREGVDEGNFFNLARDAFQSLLFAEHLSFRHFAGSYLELRDSVVKALGVLNDHFAGAHAAGKGIPYDVQARLGGLGLDVSPESPGTRGSGKLRSHRLVTFEGREYWCEWHIKIERHRNRIHFALPDSTLGGRILIGIFTTHLPT